MGEPRAVVLRRLQTDPGLVPSVVAAADARLSRKHTGKIHATVGFGIVAAGVIAGYILIATSSHRDGYGSSVAGERIALAAVVIAATAGVGFGLGIPGVVTMIKQSEAENVAADHYQHPRGPSPPATPARFSMNVPLVAFSF